MLSFARPAKMEVPNFDESFGSFQNPLNSCNEKEFVKEFKSSGVSDESVKTTNECGRTLLHYAAKMNLAKVFEACQKRKAPLSEPDSVGMTPLHYAAMEKNYSFCRKLIKAGADANILNKLGQSPLHIVAKAASASLPPKAQESIIRLVKLLLTDGQADVNQNDLEGRTAVHDAAEAGGEFLVNFLLRSEGDVHRKTMKNLTPLHCAILADSPSLPTIKTLLEAGADPSSLSEFGTAFDIVPPSLNDLSELLEEYRDKNRRGDSEFEYNLTRLSNVIVHSLEQISQEPLLQKSRLLDEHSILAEQHLDILLYLLTFLTKKVYRTPAQQSEIEDNISGSGSDRDSSSSSSCSSSSSRVSARSSNPPPSAKRKWTTRTREIYSIAEASVSLLTSGNPRKMFKVFDETGHGAYGTVHRAKTVAWQFHGLKITKGNELAIKKVQHTNEKLQWCNLDEAYFLSKSSHPNVVQFVNAYQLKHELWIVMEYLEGGSLQEAVKQTAFREKQIRYVTKRVLLALKHMHHLGFAHRDLKSANVMLSLTGDVKLIDFGLCADVTKGPLRSMCGSPFWMPPEMIQRKSHTTSCDIWSLGMLVLEMARSIPNSDSALRAMFLIGSGIVPQLRCPEKYSTDLMDFLHKTLVINQEGRSTADELLAHPFVCRDADDTNDFKQVMGHAFIQKSIEMNLY